MLITNTHACWQIIYPKVIKYIFFIKIILQEQYCSYKSKLNLNKLFIVYRDNSADEFRPRHFFKPHLFNAHKAVAGKKNTGTGKGRSTFIFRLIRLLLFFFKPTYNFNLF